MIGYQYALRDTLGVHLYSGWGGGRRPVLPPSLLPRIAQGGRACRIAVRHRAAPHRRRLQRHCRRHRQIVLHRRHTAAATILMSGGDTSGGRRRGVGRGGGRRRLLQRVRHGASAVRRPRGRGRTHRDTTAAPSSAAAPRGTRCPPLRMVGDDRLAAAAAGDVHVHAGGSHAAHVVVLGFGEARIALRNRKD
jgi:hypothetical protein